LISSEGDPEIRYAECRDLADCAEDASGIAYPSAAYAIPNAESVVLFGEAELHWIADEPAEVSTPSVDPARVRLIDS
jgi:hypothetical protein